METNFYFRCEVNAMPGLMGLDAKAKFNGMIEWQGKQIPVQNGMAQIPVPGPNGQMVQQLFMVSKDGKKLLDQSNRLIATINSGKVIPLQ
jgi:hypothetical protein